MNDKNVNYLFDLQIEKSFVLSEEGTLQFPPMVSVPCHITGSNDDNNNNTLFFKEIIKPPNVDDLYSWYEQRKKREEKEKQDETRSVGANNSEAPDPSWGVIWPTAVSLAQYCMDHSQMMKGKRVIELGCGLGLVGLVIASANNDETAKSVVLSDREPLALHCAMSTAACNNLLSSVQQQQSSSNDRNSTTELSATILDWTNIPATLKGTADIIVASDVLYDKETIEALCKACRLLLDDKNGMILIADPVKERAVGSRQLLIEALQQQKQKGDNSDTSRSTTEMEVINLPQIRLKEQGKDDISGGKMLVASPDAKDHALRMQENTILMKYTYYKHL